jgi:hypothetical protein
MMESFLIGIGVTVVIILTIALAFAIGWYLAKAFDEIFLKRRR